MNIKRLVYMGVLLVSHHSVFGNAMDTISVSGSFLGAHSLLAQEALYRSQFDYAVNLDFNLQFSDKLTGIIQLQTGPGYGSLGFQGPEAVLTDVNLNLALNEQTSITFGSFDTPFGDETNRLTNNADSFNQPFLLNSLLYSAFAGPVGTLNTLGVMLDHRTGRYTSTAALTNGTGETAVNEGNTFEVVARESISLTPFLLVSASGMYSRDRAEQGNTDTNSFGVNFAGVMLESYYDNQTYMMGMNYAVLNYDDDDRTTQDGVKTYTIHIGKRFYPFTVAARISGWIPDASANENFSEGLQSIGLGIDDGTYSVNASSALTRYQVGITYVYSDDMTFNTECVYDRYGASENRNVLGLITYINTKF